MLKPGTYLDTPVKEYRAWPAINYSSLSKFNESQDHALMEVPAKSYFEFGSAFELLIEDRAKGTKHFDNKFFIADAPGAMPDDLAGWIEGKEDLGLKYRLKKDLTRNDQSKRLHAWLDECRDHPGMMPMGKDQVEILHKMVDNFMLMQPFADQGQEITLAEILPQADFQVPIIFYKGKLRKKALLDCMFETKETVYVWDIKSAADMTRFQWMLKDKYWIQEIHYTSGARQVFPGKNIVWQFLVSSKQEPYLSKPFCLDDRSIEAAQDVYNALCLNYSEWVEAGKPAKGWLPAEAIKVFF